MTDLDLLKEDMSKVNETKKLIEQKVEQFFSEVDSSEGFHQIYWYKDRLEIDLWECFSIDTTVFAILDGYFGRNGKLIYCPGDGFLVKYYFEKEEDINE